MLWRLLSLARDGKITQGSEASSLASSQRFCRRSTPHNDNLDPTQRVRRPAHSQPAAPCCQVDQEAVSLFSGVTEGGGMSTLSLSSEAQKILIQILRELGRPATTEELVRLLRERLQTV